jgi:hypothetical protein
VEKSTLKSTERRLPKLPNAVREISKMQVVRNMQLVSPASEDYKFEMTDGSGFDVTHYKCYVIKDQLGHPILSTVINGVGPLFSSQFIKDYCFKNGLTAHIQGENVILRVKLSAQKSNVFNFMRFYDFLVFIRKLSEFKEVINVT